MATSFDENNRVQANDFLMVMKAVMFQPSYPSSAFKRKSFESIFAKVHHGTVPLRESGLLIRDLAMPVSTASVVQSNCPWIDRDTTP
jgi:hypothetical protein